MADLGFDFSDDQDDYQQYEEPYEDDDNVPTLPTPPSQQHQSQQQHDVSDGGNKSTVILKRHEQNKEITTQHLNGTDNSNETSMDHDAQQPQQRLEDLPPYEEDEEEEGREEQAYEDIYTKETNLLIGSNRLLEAPEEGYSTDSLLDAILTEDANEGDLDESIIIDMDESLTPVERVYKYSKSNVIFHRHLIAKELPVALYDVDINEAVTDMFPLVLRVAHDEDEAVRETLASELDKIIMYFYQNAPPLMEPKSTSDQPQQNDDTHMDLENNNSAMEKANNNDNETKFIYSDKDQHYTRVLEEGKRKPTSTENQRSLPSSEQRTDIEDTPRGPLSSDQVDEKLAPTSTSTTTTTSTTTLSTRPHIPSKKFAPLLIELLLDQNSNLASLGQQCIVAVAAELASTPSDSDRATLDRFLLDTEIYDGVVMGLMDIVHGKSTMQLGLDSGDGMNQDEENLSANLSATSIDNNNNNNNSSSSKGVIRRPSATPGFESSSSSMGPPPVDEDSRQGEINLAKMMCLTLISALTVVLGSEWATNFSLPIVEQLAPDPMFYVRKEAAAAIGSIATVVNMDVATNRLLPLYLELSRDTIWHVRRSCVLTLPLLCQVLPNDTKCHIATEGVERFKNDVSRNVRNTLAEVIGELIAKFLPEDWKESGRPGHVPDPLLDFFLSLGANGNSNQMFKMETDRTIICAYNFPAVVLTVGAGYWDSHLKDTYLSLTKDYQIKVRRTFAYSLHEIARIIGPERTESDLVQIFALYLMDLDDVKQGVLEHLAEFLGTLTVSSRNEYIPILTEVWDGVMTNWRLRDILAAQLRDISLLFDAARVVEHVLPLALRACNDEFAAVRETVVDAFPVILDIVKRAVDEQGEGLIHDDDDDPRDISDEEEDDEDTKENKRNFALALLNHVIERLDEFVRSNSHRGRLVFTHICRSLLEAGISASDFASFFLSRLAPLTVDEIVNVRIGTARTLRQIYLNNSYRQELDDLTTEGDDHNNAPSSSLLEQMIYRLALDEDEDVRYFVLDLVDSDRLDENKDEFLAAQQQQQRNGQYLQHDYDEDDEDESENDQPDLNSAHYISSSSSSNPSFSKSPLSMQQPSTGHHLMRRILSDDDDDDDNNNNITQPHTDNLDDEHVNENSSSSNKNDEEATSMDCTEDGSVDSSNNKKNHDEDGDALMMDAQLEQDDDDDDDGDDDDDEPAMIGDEDGDPDSAVTDEKEKGEYVYLTKTGTHETTTTTLLASSPSLDKKTAV